MDYPAWFGSRVRGDRHAKPLISRDSEGSNLGSDAISMMVASDNNDEAESEHIQIGHLKNPVLEGLHIVDLAFVCRHLAFISR